MDRGFGEFWYLGVTPLKRVPSSLQDFLNFASSLLGILHIPKELSEFLLLSATRAGRSIDHRIATRLDLKPNRESAAGENGVAYITAHFVNLRIAPNPNHTCVHGLHEPSLPVNNVSAHYKSTDVLFCRINFLSNLSVGNKEPSCDGSFDLTLRPLRALAGFLETWLLALLGAWVAHKELRGLEDLAGLRLYFNKGTGDSMAERVCLSGDAAS